MHCDAFYRLKNRQECIALIYMEVKVPYMGDSIVDGILAKWHVRDGDTVVVDQLIYTLETDKIAADGVANAAGVIQLKVPEGARVAIEQVLAEIR